MYVPRGVLTSQELFGWLRLLRGCVVLPSTSIFRLVHYNINGYVIHHTVEIQRNNYVTCYPNWEICNDLINYGGFSMSINFSGNGL